MKIFSDFNSTGFERIFDTLKGNVEIISQPYGQFFQSIKSSIIERYNGYCVFWINLSSISPSYKKSLANEEFCESEIFIELNNYVNLIKKLAETAKAVFVCSFYQEPYSNGIGIGDLKENQTGFLLAKANYQLYSDFSNESNIFCLETTKWFQNKDFYNAKLFYAGKIKFNQSVLKEAASDIIAGINAIEGKSKKLLVLDLDNTLWGGILGDDGKEGIKLGAPSMVGEAFLHFQQEIRALKNRGVILAIASKNYEENAIEAINTHPEMQLRVCDFSAWRINWNDKAKNILEIVQELNIGLDSVVFIDDNPAERSRVSEALPEVYVPQWPLDPLEYVVALRKLKCFSACSLSNEDKNKAEMFLHEKQRKELKSDISNHDEWLEAMKMKLIIEPVSKNNILRVVQLINKTNQFNLCTRRITQVELEKWLASGNQMLTYRLLDKFGDMGLIGITGLEVCADKAVISDVILSCRAMGRGVERVMLHWIIEAAFSKGFFEVELNYIETKKNKPILDFLKEVDIISDESFKAIIRKNITLPKYIEVISK